MIFEQFRKIEWRNHADFLRIDELLIRAFVDAFEKRKCIVDKYIDMSALRQNVVGESFQRRFVGKIADKPRPLFDVNDMDHGAFVFEAFRTVFADALRSACDDDDLSLNDISINVSPPVFRYR